MSNLFRLLAYRLLAWAVVLLLLVPAAVADDNWWCEDIQIQYLTWDGVAPDENFCVRDAGKFEAAELDYCVCNRCEPSFGDELTCRLTAMAKSMEAQGIVYAPSVTPFYQGVASGGQEQLFEFGGKVDQFLILDGGKLGVWQGLTMNMHVETRYGDDVNLDAVGLAPVNVAMLYPKSGEHDTAITGLTLTQALSEEWLVSAGKFNALDMFYGLYPQTGRGVNTFMNASIALPLSAARVVPLSFMGAGVTKMRGTRAEAGLTVFDPQNVTTTSGFDDLFDNGANILGFWRFFTDVNGLPGSHLFGGVGATGDFVAFDSGGFVIVPGQGVVVAPTQSGSWWLFYILEQTLWADRCNKSRNIGLLSQWGLADERTTPFAWTANVTLQAEGMLYSRPYDTLGVGWFYSGLSDDFEALLDPVIPLHDVQGVELFYNAAITKFFHLTADLQVIEPAEIAADTAVVIGLRGMVGL